MILARKIQLLPIGDKEEVNRVYKYLRDGMFNQNKAMNQYMSALYMAKMVEITDKDDRKELNNLYSRNSDSKKGSAYDKDINFPIGLGTTSMLAFKVRKDFSNACKNGLLYGKMSLPTYKENSSLLVHNDYVTLKALSPKNDGIYHNYESHTEFLDHLYLNDLEIFIKFANDITFKMIFGNPYKSAFLRSEIQQVFEEYYKVCDSSIQINKKDQIILNLSLEIPEKEVELDENIVVGVDLGVRTPAVCGLNNNEYKSKYVGAAEDLIRVRTQMQNQRKRCQRSLKRTSGGHGRNKKLKALNRFRDREANFAKTYNHSVSKDVVDFALKNGAKYINLECLKGYDTNEFILRNWSYYELQRQITYKAAKYGIIVRKINPCYTSQVCSHCGHWELGQRDGAYFKCKSCGMESNADFNAAKNIAKSTLWLEEEVDEDEKKVAREYYGIVVDDNCEDDGEKCKKASKKSKKKKLKK